MSKDRARALAEAHAAEDEGDWKTAGDAFDCAGEYDHAARAYLRCGHFVEAAESLRRLAGISPADQQRAALLRATICFCQAGRIQEAAKIFVRLGENKRAAELFRSLGDTVSAEKLEAKAPEGSQVAEQTKDNLFSTPSTVVEPNLSEGTVIKDRYRLVRRIGQGGMGVVFEAFDKSWDTAIAIKFLLAEHANEENAIRFRQELFLSERFRHRNVLRMYDLGSHRGTKYITMELLKGEDLGSILKREMLPLEKSIDLLIQAAHAVQVVHDQGIVHRDIKPDNFFLTVDGTLKIIDFGIAKLLAAHRGLTRDGMTAGTPHYIAPEQVSDFARASHLADVYSLGCIAYHMLTGVVPFDGADAMPIFLAHQSKSPIPPRDRNPAVPPELDAIVLRLLAKEPQQRIQSCRELAEMLAKVV